MNIKEIREKLGMTQQKMAEELGVSVQTICNWEAGKKIASTKKLQIENWIKGNSNIIGSVVGGNIDNRQYFSDSPDVLRKEIDLLDERIKEKDAQIKTLLDILNNYSVNCNKK